jgi:putative membrane protein
VRNIVALFRHDLRQATRNVIPVVVLFGVVVIPSFFGWFNVLASWNPFGNVKNLQVAVASADKGYESDLFPVRVNLGAQVISTLRANTDLNWAFTTEKEAIQGTKEGKYYAALVLPPDFSRAMLTFLAPGAKPADIGYFINEKLNALTPKITGEAATEVSTKINEGFTKTLNEVGLALIASLADHLEDPSTQNALERMSSNAHALSVQLTSGAATAEMFSSLVGSSKPLVTSAASLVTSSTDAFAKTAGALAGGAHAARSLQATLAAAAASLPAALASSAASYKALAKQVDELFASVGEQSQDAAAALRTLSDDVGTQVAAYQQMRDDLAATAAAATDPVLKNALDMVVDQLDGAIERQQALQTRISDAADGIASTDADGEAAKKAIAALIDDAKSAIHTAQRTYARSVQPKLKQLAGTLGAINSGFASVGSDLAGASSALTGGSGSVLAALTNAQQTTDGLAAGLTGAAGNLDKLSAALHTATETGDLREVTAIVGSDAGVAATRLTEPVGLDTIPVFRMKTFGAQMAPFYTVLGLWVGALLLSVLISTKVVPGSVEFRRPLNAAEEYFGRYGLFALLALLQSTLLYVGLIGFVGVRPVDPLLLILAGWVMSLVFSLITYTLVLSFGEAGKALAVFLLVVQISAGGGAYPLPVLPEWFQNISPFLPVTHATDAVRAAIAGGYDGDFWVNIGQLALFVPVALLIGLVLRLPMRKVNAKLDEALESTKLM